MILEVENQTRKWHRVASSGKGYGGGNIRLCILFMGCMRVLLETLIILILPGEPRLFPRFLGAFRFRCQFSSASGIHPKTHLSVSLLTCCGRYFYGRPNELIFKMRFVLQVYMPKHKAGDLSQKTINLIGSCYKYWNNNGIFFLCFRIRWSLYWWVHSPAVLFSFFL